ncbi:zona pellucida sperm-binding protein 4-like [Ambystoma mexicanum]|uniref:zona pellucida sperm-binding protein 4-like n=1 Tax=Ambystoma mexicanum TaxID=8296 RepID=UPI0037E7DC48
MVSAAFGGVFLLLGAVCGAQLGAGPLLAIGDNPKLSCGPHSMQLSLPLRSGTPFAGFVEDKAGMAVILQNDTDCGTWVSRRPDGSVNIGADYTGCYVSKRDGEYTMTLAVPSLPGLDLPKQLKCPVLPDSSLAMDAPAPDVCAAVGTADRLSCGAAMVSPDVCVKYGCCSNPRDSTTPCYFGSPVTAYCTPEGQAVIAVSARVTVPSLNLGSVRLVSVTSTCSGLDVSRNGAFLVYQFPLSCGGSSQVDGHLVYENRLEASQEFQSWSGSSITRDSTFGLTVRCSFSASGALPLQVEVFTLPPPAPVSSPGPLVLEMRLAKEQTYGSYYSDSEYPVVKILREPVFVEVRVLQRTDPSLVLVLSECWATHSSNSMQQPQWPILVNRCPFPGDNYQSLLVTVGATSLLRFPSHYQRFAVSTFTFVENAQLNLRGQIYFHCSASVCVPSVAGDCSTACPSRRRRSAASWTSQTMSRVTAPGPVYFTSEEEGSLLLEGSRSVRPVAAVMPQWIVGALVAVGLLAVAMFSVGLWNYCRKPESKTVDVTV